MESNKIQLRIKKVDMKKIYVIMGVSGCGKSTIGERIADFFNYNFHDGDDFHPQANIDKMSTGNQLTDNDREPWLKAINNHMKEQKSTSLYACSSLKEKYRIILSENIESIDFIYLKGSFELIYNRISKRKNHFMTTELLQSQFDTLEEPKGAIEIDIRNSVEDIIENLKFKLK